MTAPRPAVFFDRDGVVNVSPGAGYVERWEDFHFSPGIERALKLCHARGYVLVLVTSQQCVGKGIITHAALDAMHDKMQAHLRANGTPFDLILACTHLAGTCECRKPAPKMIFDAKEALGLDLSRSWLVGDHDRDIQMAVNAGVPNTIRIISHHQPQVEASHTLATVEPLAELLETVLDERR